MKDSGGGILLLLLGVGAIWYLSSSQSKVQIGSAANPIVVTDPNTGLPMGPEPVQPIQVGPNTPQGPGLSNLTEPIMTVNALQQIGLL